MAAIYSRLDERPLEGFGGVSEYGITVRWDKNFLTLIHLTLARRPALRIYGGVRFGGTLTIDDAWALGFDHVAIAAGAGKPDDRRHEEQPARGIRQASDFLMALQLTGAFKRGASPTCRCACPAVVIGGGLTAIDTATELMAYYPLQVEKILDRYEAPVRASTASRHPCGVRPGRAGDRSTSSSSTAATCARAGRRRARPANRRTSCRSWSWGGVSIVYRADADSPAYRLNHEEVTGARGRHRASSSA